MMISFINLKINSISFFQFLLCVKVQLNQFKNASFAHFRWHHLQDERKFLIRCVDISTRMGSCNVSLYCLALGVPERAKLLSSSCKNLKTATGMVVFNYLKENSRYSLYLSQLLRHFLHRCYQ